VLIYGEGHGEVGRGRMAEIVGEPNRGAGKFHHDERSRFQVGIQGMRWPAGLPAGRRHSPRSACKAARRGSAGPVPIIEHPDVAPHLNADEAQTQAAVRWPIAAGMSDLAHAHADPECARRRKRPTNICADRQGVEHEMAVEVASIGFSARGMGYIEETGAAQHYRDARILPIYEGTTAIQANDLLSRKTARDGARWCAR